MYDGWCLFYENKSLKSSSFELLWADQASKCRSQTSAFYSANFYDFEMKGQTEDRTKPSLWNFVTLIGDLVYGFRGFLLVSYETVKELTKPPRLVYNEFYPFLSHKWMQFYSRCPTNVWFVLKAKKMKIFWRFQLIGYPNNSSLVNIKVS